MGLLKLSCCLGIAAIVGCTAKEGGVPFDSKVWKQDIAARPMMIKDLQTQLKSGTSRSEVIAMLGEPDEILQGSEVTAAESSSEYLYYKSPLGEEAFDVSQFIVVIKSGQVRKSFLFEN